VITGRWVFMSGVGFDGDLCRYDWDYALGVKQPLTDYYNDDGLCVLICVGWVSCLLDAKLWDL